MVITICKIFFLIHTKKIRFLSQVLVKIYNVEIHTFWGSGQFDEKTNSIGFPIVHWIQIIPVDKTPQASGSSDGNKDLKWGLKKGLLETMHKPLRFYGVNKVKTLRINHRVPSVANLPEAKNLIQYFLILDALIAGPSGSLGKCF